MHLFIYFRTSFSGYEEREMKEWPLVWYSFGWYSSFSPSLQYVDEEDLVNVIKGFSTVTKEHTTFTDTHLWRTKPAFLESGSG